MGDSGGAKVSGSNSSINRIELPDWYKQYPWEAASQAQAVYRMQTNDMYNGNGPPSLYVGMDPATQRALGMVENQIGAGQSGVPQTAIDEWSKTMRGEYLGNNPWLDDIAKRAGYAAENRLNSQYGAGQGFGGSAWSGSLADALTQTNAQLYGDNYQQERNRMGQYLGFAPQAENLQYANATRLGMVGQRREEDQMAKQIEENRQYNKLWDPLEKYASLVYGNPGQKEATVYESGKSSSKQSNAFDWAAFVGGII